jgi:hypothetical protein
MKTLALIILTLLIISCNNENQISEEPSSNSTNEIGENSHVIDAEKGGLIKTKQGSVINIPAAAFVDKNGDGIKGEVAIHFEEYHDYADIAMSNISMFYDTAGVQTDLKSGGMFDISGSQNGEEIFIAKGKKVGVDLASIEDTPCFNFYKQEKESGNWDYLHTDNGKRVDSLKPNQLPKDPSDQDLSNALFIDINYTDIPELKMFEELVWRYVGDEIPAIATQTNWKKAKITPVEGEEYVYNLKLTGGGKVYNWKVEPIYSGKNLELAMSQYQGTIAKMKADPNSIYYRPKQIRSVDIEGFGIYNWDVKNKRGDDQVSFPILAKVNGKEPEDIRVSLISIDENIVVNYEKSNFGNFSYNPNSKSILVAFYDNGKIAVLKPSQMKKLNRHKGKKTAVTVDLTAKGGKTYDEFQLKELISGLIGA